MFNQMGASLAMVGILFGVLPFVQCAIKPITGALADKFQIPKTVFVICLVIVTVLFFSINFIPEMDRMPQQLMEVKMPENSTSLFYNVTSDKLTLMGCNQDFVNNATLTTCRLSCKDSDEPGLGFDFDDSGQYDIKNVTANMSTEWTSTQFFNGFQNASWHCDHFQLLTLAFVLDDNGSVWQSSDSITAGRLSNESFLLPCSAECLALSSKHKSEAIMEGSNYRLVWIWVACILIWGAMGTVVSASDAILLNLLGDQRDNYGFTRLFGSAGWGIISVVAAQLIDYASVGQPRQDFSPGFYIFFGLMIFDLLVTIPLTVEHCEKPKALVMEVLVLFKNVEFSLFAFATLMVGVVTGMMWTFVVIFVNELNAPQLVIGVNYAVECFVSEIPLFLVSGWIVNKLGHHYAMTLVLILSGLKALCYAFIYDAWYVVLVALLHGPNYAGFYATAATYASIVAPPGASMTLQSLIQGLFEGAGTYFF